MRDALRYGRVKLFYIQLYELAILLFVDVTEPVNDFVGIWPLILFQLGQQVFVDVVQKNFTYFAFSLCDGLIWWHDEFDRNLPLWFFSVAYAGVSTSFSLRSLKLIFVAMCFASKLIDICNFGGAFLYALVTLSPKSFCVAPLTFCCCWFYQQK